MAQHQTATQAAPISSPADRIKGTHRDLVTCGDLHRMRLQYACGATVDSGGYISVNQAPVPLPVTASTANPLPCPAVVQPARQGARHKAPGRNKPSRGQGRQPGAQA
jgi:hypothetical protein